MASASLFPSRMGNPPVISVEDFPLLHTKKQKRKKKYFESMRRVTRAFNSTSQNVFHVDANLGTIECTAGIKEKQRMLECFF